jgi:hypothetical protein
VDRIVPRQQVAPVQFEIANGRIIVSNRPPRTAEMTEPAGGPVFEPYESPAGGWGALQVTARALREQSIALKGSGVLMAMNQPDGV